MKARPAVLTLALATSGIGLAHGQATLKPDGQFRAALGLGFSASSGNSDASNVSLTFDAVRATEQDRTSLYGNAQYARTEGETTADQVRLGGRQDHNLSPATFAFGGLDFERNRFANLKLRSQLSGGLGWHMIKGETTTFDVFGGLSYSADKYLDPMFVGGENRRSYSYLGLMLGEESTHRLSDNTSAKQRLTVVPNLDDSGEYRANWDAGLAVAMSQLMSLNVGFSVAYNSDPGTGRKSTDTLFTSGISVNFE
jgi:putative salt-induced outer membrane protein YdiY